MIAALVGALIGGFLTVLGAWAQAWYARCQRINSLRSSIGAEISTLVALARANEYEARLRDSAEAMAAAISDDKLPAPVVLPASHNYFSVFEANAHDIGELRRELAAEVIAFYQATRSWLDTLHRDNAADQVAMSQAERVAFLAMMAGRIQRLCDFGDRLSLELTPEPVLADLVKVRKFLEGTATQLVNVVGV